MTSELGPVLAQRLNQLCSAVGVDIPRQHGVHSHAVLGFVDRQRFGEGANCALGGCVERGTFLTKHRRATTHVNDIALGFAQMGQSVLTTNELTEEIRREHTLQIVHREMVDRRLWWVIAGVVDQAAVDE